MIPEKTSIFRFSRHKNGVRDGRESRGRHGSGLVAVRGEKELYLDVPQRSGRSRVRVPDVQTPVKGVGATTRGRRDVHVSHARPAAVRCQGEDQGGS